MRTPAYSASSKVELLLMHAASRISQLSAEMLAAPVDDDDPFLTSDDDENERNDC